MNIIELTNEEYNAVMESREVLDEKSRIDKYIDDKAKQVEKHRKIADLYSGAAKNASSEKVKEKLKEKSNRENKLANLKNDIKNDRFDATNYSRIKKEARKGNPTGKGNPIGGLLISDLQDARNAYKSHGSSPEEKLKKNRYLELYKSKKAIEGK